MLDPQKVRKDFPLLFADTGKQPLVYFDNAATTQKPEAVLQRLRRYYVEENANINRGAYDLAAKATDAYEHARQLVQSFIGARKTSEVIFTKGTTEAINFCATSFVRPRIKAGDEILISGMEHHANLVPWQVVCQQQQAQLKIIPVNDSGEVELSTYRDLLGPRTRFVALTHISNALGNVNPVQEMIQLAHALDVPVLLDAAQSIPHQSVNVQDIECDFLAFSGHKLYGPTGIGVLYAKSVWHPHMQPYQFGGDMIRMVSYENTTYNVPPHKFEAGTPNIAGAVGLGAAIQYINKIGMHNIQTHTEDLTAYARKQLAGIQDLQLIGSADHTSSIISFVFPDIHPHDVSSLLNEAGIAIRAGHHCTMPLMQRLGLPGTARVSFGMYNTKEEVDHLIHALLEVQEIFS
ncbi:MAG: cysteine desulfurase [Bacteroidota bacterium]